MIVLVSCGCCSKLPPSWWLKNKFILSQLWRPGVWSQYQWAKIRLLPPKAQEGTVPCFFHSLVPARIPWLVVVASLQSSKAEFQVSLSSLLLITFSYVWEEREKPLIASLLWGHVWWHFSSPLLQNNLPVTGSLITSAKAPLPNNVTFTGSKD